MKGFATGFILICLGLFSTIDVSAQKSDDIFSKAYLHLVDSVLPMNMEQAKRGADSLFKASTDDIQRTRSLLLLAVISTQFGSQVDALSFALEAKEFAIKARNDEWQVRAAGFLSVTFRDVNLKAEALEHIDLAERANAKLKHSPGYHYVQANIHKERAFFAVENENFDEAISELGKSKSHIDLLEKSAQPYFLITYHGLMGNSYLGLEEYNQAKLQFQSGIDLLANSGSILEPDLYRGMGEVELQAKNYPAALDYFKKAETYRSSHQHFSTQMLIFKGLSDYYKAVDMHKEALHYDELYLKAYRDKASASEEIFNQLISKSHERQKASQARAYYFLAYALLSILLIGGLLARLRFIKRREREKYKALIGSINNNSPLLVSMREESRSKEVQNPQPKQKDVSIMPKETEGRILSELSAMEKDLFFTQKDVSLATLAAKLNTNTKYISYLIKTHKDRDFNNYINELRIRYIVTKFHANPEYLSYKLAYIADELGFSSHSKFAAVFKNVTGLSPSVFIANIKMDMPKQTQRDGAYY